MARDLSSNNVNNFLNVGDVAAIDITGTALSVSAWYKADQTDAVFRGLLGKGNISSGTQQQYVLWKYNTNKVAFRVGDAGGIDDAVGATTITAGVWQHYGGVKNGTGAGALRAFLNGALDGTATSNRSIQNRAEALNLGRSDGIGAFVCDGHLAEVGIWNVALTDAEMAILGRGFSPLFVRPQSLVGYWPLLGNASPETDFRNGNGASINGSVPKSPDHPRIYRPCPAIYIP